MDTIEEMEFTHNMLRYQDTPRVKLSAIPVRVARFSDQPEDYRNQQRPPLIGGCLQQTMAEDNLSKGEPFFQESLVPPEKI